MIANFHKDNFDTLKLAAENEDLALVECQRVSDGQAASNAATAALPIWSKASGRTSRLKVLRIRASGEIRPQCAHHRNELGE